MDNRVKTIVADSNFLILEGLYNVLKTCEEVEVLGKCATAEELVGMAIRYKPQVLLIDYTCKAIGFSTLQDLMRANPEIRVVGISQECDVVQIRKLIEQGLSGHLMNDCDRDEVLQSIISVAKGEKFFCGKVLDKLNESVGEATKHDCDSVVISERELEILQLIAEGLTTKQIGEKLHISFHTVMTHRKNMMAKIGLNNTAGLIVYAVKENLISPNKFLFNS